VKEATQRQAPSDPIPDEGKPDEEIDTGSEIPGDRGESVLHRARSLQSRVGQVLAIGLMGAMAIGLLGWYYVRTLNKPAEVRRAAQTVSRNQASGDAPLPPLGPITLPEVAAEKVLGPAPAALPSADPPPASAVLQPEPTPGAAQPQAKTPAELALERRLAGPAFSRSNDSAAGAPAGVTAAVAGEGDLTTLKGAPARVDAASGRLQELLKPSLTPAASAEVLPTQRLLLPKGAFLDCTLETAIDSTLPGMTTCITATDTFSADGSTVLLERGTKLVGETRGEVTQGAARVFVLWTEARTPTGVVIPLASPGTDELGRSGLAGSVNRHFFQRFGAAILISVINGAIQAAVTERNNGGTVIYNPSSSQDVMTEVLKDTLNIPPTVTKPQGDRIQVLVARDLDFRTVYELKPTPSK
jgi:type IV secretion system protein VirB10